MRSALRMVLLTSRDLQVCAEAADDYEAIKKATELKPDLILLDIAMPRLEGVATAPALRQVVPDTKIVFCTLYPELGMNVASSAGVDLVVAKSDGANVILEKLQSVFSS